LAWKQALPASFFGFFCGVKAVFVLRALHGLDAPLPVLRRRIPSLSSATSSRGPSASLIAAFAIMVIGVLPDRRSRPDAQALGDVLLGLGMAYSIWALLYLRRSFSILPEARRLGTQGPYALSRHPQYLGEGVAAVGLLVTAAGPTGIVLALAALGAPLLRMRWEESVLTCEFPEYVIYARHVPRYIPFLA
jgi:protein-S-isoprenylcysteine O-methyltransferase Ste14